MQTNGWGQKTSLTPWLPALGAVALAFDYSKVAFTFGFFPLLLLHFFVAITQRPQLPLPYPFGPAQKALAVLLPLAFAGLWYAGKTWWAMALNIVPMVFSYVMYLKAKRLGLAAVVTSTAAPTK